MKGRMIKTRVPAAVVTLALAVVCTLGACSEAQDTSGRALGNANSVVRSVAPKVWNTDADTGRAAMSPQEEEELRERNRK